MPLSGRPGTYCYGATPAVHHAACTVGFAAASLARCLTVAGVSRIVAVVAEVMLAI